MQKLAVFLHSGDYDRVHHGLAAAAAAVAVGRPTNVFFFWWALDRLVRDQLDEPSFGPGREDAEARFEARQMPTLRQLLAHLRASGLCRLYACSGSAAALAATPEEISEKVDELVGWTTILKLTAGVTDRVSL